MSTRLNNGVADQSRQFAMIPFDVIEAVQDARALALYVILKRFANYHTKLAYPTRARLAEMMGYKSARAVDEALTLLGDLGLVRTIPRYIHTDTNEVIHEPRKGFAQGANGYILTDILHTPVHQEVHPPRHRGAAPLDTEVHPPYTYSQHKLYKDKIYKIELDDSPLTPQGGEVPEPVEAVQAKAKKKNTRGEFLPEGWEPPRAVIDAMQAEFPSLDLWQVHLRFCDYWHSASGQNARKRDWVATWRNWVRREGERAPRGAGRGKSTPQEWLDLAASMQSQQQPTFSDAPAIEQGWS